MATVKPRSVTPLIAGIRNILNGRKVTNPLRYEQLQTPRTQPLPKLPYGCSHKLEANDYWARDGRRESMPAVVTYEHTSKAIGSGTDCQQAKSPAVKTPVPGIKTCNWDM